MFATRYFAKRYFAGRYFPPVGVPVVENEPVARIHIGTPQKVLKIVLSAVNVLAIDVGTPRKVMTVALSAQTATGSRSLCCAARAAGAA